MYLALHAIREVGCISWPGMKKELIAAKALRELEEALKLLKSVTDLSFNDKAAIERHLEIAIKAITSFALEK